MPSVPFCNLNEIYGDNWNKKKVVSSKEQTQVSIEQANNLLRNIKVEENNSNNSNIQNIPNHQNTKDINIKTYANNSADINNIPNIPTFQTAANCNQRNNNFQNQIALSQFNLPVNPLNNMYNMPTNMPNMHNINVPMNLPIYNNTNIWPAQRWFPENPMAYAISDPYNQYYNPMINSQFNQGNKMREDFSQDSDNNKVIMLLQLILFTLIALFVIQIFELLLRIC